jgi:chemotaxis signal transduction protein
MEAVLDDMSAPELPGARRVAPTLSEALNRFEPPPGFVPVTIERQVKTIRYGFHAAGLSLLIRQGVVSEIVPMMPFAEIPNGPGWLLGVINLHGNLVPVCDLGRALGSDAGAGSAKPMILVIDKGAKSAGFLIDGYPRALVDLRPASQVQGLPDLLARHVAATLTTKEEVWLEFDHEGFLEGANRQ